MRISRADPSVQERAVKEILMLRAKWRELETEPRTRLDGHEGGNPGYSQALARLRFAALASTF